MNNTLPKINSNKKICVVCEGFEEYEYLKTLISLDLFSSKYDIDLKNAESNGNIPSIYFYYHQQNSYDIVLIFCDTDREPFEDYKLIKKKINEYHDADVASDIIIFANPCTMQIILSHLGNVKLKSQNKTKNRQKIFELTNIENYGAHEEQRKRLFSLINYQNYIDMKKNLSKICNNEDKTPSTNFLTFINNLESNDTNWITIINKKIKNKETSLVNC